MDMEVVADTSEIIRSTPVAVAALHNEHAVVLWLVLQGACADASGDFDLHELGQVQIQHFDSLAKYTAHCQLHGFPVSWHHLKASLEELLEQRAIFTRLVLPAVCVGNKADGCIQSLRESSKMKFERSSASLLGLFSGHTDAVLVLVSVFVGVVRGLELRNANRAFDYLRSHDEA